MQTEVLSPPLRSTPRPSGVEVDTIVLHATAGSTLSGAVSTLRQKGLGYHYIIDKDGTVYKGCAASRSTGHAGNSYGPHEEAAGVSRKQNTKAEFTARCSVNPYTIGISFVDENVLPGDLKAVQVDAARELCIALKAQFPKLRYVTKHALVSPRRKTDPMRLGLIAFAASVSLAPWQYGGGL